MLSLCTTYSYLSTYRPSVSLLISFQPEHHFSNPFQAFRFVSLIPFERLETIGGKRIEVWNTIHKFLAKGSGDVEDHCTLLCSLLLGFGLEAYIAIGTLKNESQPSLHTWVITRARNTDSTEKGTLFWETTNGLRMKTNEIKEVYRTITCVFSEYEFYANIQEDDSVENASYEFEDETKWKRMNKDILKSTKHWNFPIKLLMGEKDSEAISEETENAIRNLITEYRHTAINDMAVFDSELSSLLVPLLENYEMERVFGKSIEVDKAKMALSQVVPSGYSFKAFPIQVTSADAKEIFAGIMQNKTGRKILETKGDSVRFGMRVKAIVYPENAIGTWTLIAVKYLPL